MLPGVAKRGVAVVLGSRRGLRRVTVAVLTVLFLATGATSILAGPASAAGVDQRVVLDSGRAYILHIPPALRSHPSLADGRPAMIVLHAVRTDAGDAERSTGFDKLSDRDGVLVAYPEGIRRSFNAGLCCEGAVQFGVDDVGFLSDVVGDLRARGARRISVVGFSNGGMMAYRFACERPELVDTVGVLSGTLEIPFCKGPIRALHLHGLADTAVPFTGAVYSQRLHCFLRDVRTIPEVAPGSSITIRTLPGYGHRWTQPGDPVDATELFWQFAGM